jgi:hypothetical protein
MMACVVFEIRYYVTETESTNDDAARCSGSRKPAMARRSGPTFSARARPPRAQLGIAPPGSSLLFTAILPGADRGVGALWAVPFWTALGVADGIEAATAVLRVDAAMAERSAARRPQVLRNPVHLARRRRARLGRLRHGLNVVRPAGDAELDEVDPPPAFLSDASRRRRTSRARRDPSCPRRRVRPSLGPSAVARAWEARAPPRHDRIASWSTAMRSRSRRRALRLAADGGLVVDVEGRERSHLACRRARRALALRTTRRERAFSQVSQKCESLLSVS